MPKAKATSTTPKKTTRKTKAEKEKTLLEAAAEAAAPEETAPEATAATDEPTTEVATAADSSVELSAAEAETANNAPVEAAETAPDAATTEAISWGAIVEKLPPDMMDRAMDYLARNISVKESWAWLGTEDKPLRTRLTKGFQSTANSLRLPAVRSRLRDEMRHSVDFLAGLMTLWSQTTPEPPVIAAVKDLDDVAAIEQLPTLLRRFGEEALLLALMTAHRDHVLDAWATKYLAGELTIEPGAEVEEGKAQDSEKQSLASQLKTAQSEAERLRNRVSTLEKKLQETEAAFTTAKDRYASELHRLQAQLKQESNRFVQEHEKLEEDERLLDRTTRKLKSAEKQVEELETENKKLKKQVRQQQEVSEELRKEMAALQTTIEELEHRLEEGGAEEEIYAESSEAPVVASGMPLPAVMVPASRSLSTSPFDQAFLWNADGRQIRVTPREIKKGIDANNEGWVFSLIQAMDALKHLSPEAYQMLMERMKELDPYYFRVLTGRTTRILVDASNVARYERNRTGKGQMRYLLAMRDELRRRACFPIRFVADASLPYNVDHPEDLQAMARRGELELTPAGTEADDILAHEARRTGAFVVTNDRNFHRKTSPPGFEPPRLSFQFYDKYVVIDEF